MYWNNEGEVWLESSHIHVQSTLQTNFTFVGHGRGYKHFSEKKLYELWKYNINSPICKYPLHDYYETFIVDIVDGH